MWGDLNNIWKEAFSLAWESYMNDSVPIGAVIVDAKDKIITRGRNRIFDDHSTNSLSGTLMAHAEMTAMMQLKLKEHPDIRTYIIYTTMEPCPMCFGTMLMMHICNLKYAARDGYAGATKLKDKIDYVNKKKMDIERGFEEIEAFQITLQSAYEYKSSHSRIEEVFDSWRTYCSNGVELGKKLYEEKYFINAIKENTNIAEIYDYVITKYQNLNMGQ